MTLDSNLPVLGFVGFSGTGKTTLLKKLLPKLQENGIRVGMIKHAHHNFDIDKPGKDSYELRQAGASQMLIASAKRWALMVENDINQNEPSLSDLVTQFNSEKIDVILVEGFKHEHFPKIELHRSDLGQAYLFPNDGSVIAIASDIKPDIKPHPEWMNINNPDEILKFILELTKKPLSRLD